MENGQEQTQAKRHNVAPKKLDIGLIYVLPKSLEEVSVDG
jgi:hypothetical protein